MVAMVERIVGLLLDWEKEISGVCHGQGAREWWPGLPILGLVHHSPLNCILDYSGELSRAWIVPIEILNHIL